MTFAPAESFGLRNALFDCDPHLRHYLAKAVTSDFFTAERDNGDGPMMAGLWPIVVKKERNVRGFLCAAVFYDLP
jgi:hypothetical protein